MRTEPRGDVQEPLGGRITLRRLLPWFAFSIVLVAIGIILILTHHRSVGLALIVVSVAAGFVIRMRLMIQAVRSQQR